MIPQNYHLYNHIGKTIEKCTTEKLGFHKRISKKLSMTAEILEEKKQRRSQKYY